ncbi:hypothetical protein LTR08_001550 [Meristemomyces frigidus]|nr:hypothetical protein LTR08_001550 [Meristemomyces frigidus]
MAAGREPAMPSRDTQEQAPPPPPPRQPSLLPAFEPFLPSSSPMGRHSLPRPSSKRKFTATFDPDNRRTAYYPTPVPTSSTGILHCGSSPPSHFARPHLSRAVSTLSERAPLGDMPTLDLLADGEPVLMGRSSNSSDYQLSANRHISRVHVRAAYLAPDVESPAGRVQVECLGWNGAKVHCRGEIVELAKGETFVSGQPMAQVIVDVQDTRVMLVWPKDGQSQEVSRVGSRSPWGMESPTKVPRTLSSGGPMHFASSPPPMLPALAEPRSPVSPTPNAVTLVSTFSSTFRSDQQDDEEVQVYEDHSSEEDDRNSTPEAVTAAALSPEEQHNTPTIAAAQQPATSSRSTPTPSPEELSEHDEENDPIVHSFGPFGADILHRFQSFQPTSPDRARKPLDPSSLNSPGRKATLPRDVNASPIKNHIINQLAFSRVHSLPLSTLHSNLPAELRGARTARSVVSATEKHDAALSAAELKTILDAVPCVGTIVREGKDAAGKLLESEFYYVPERDGDEMRREAVTGSLGRTGMREARKVHKQYYWKRPRH